MLASVVLGPVAGLLSLVLVGLPLLFSVQVVVYYLFGRGFVDAVGRGRRASRASSPPADR